MLPLLGLRVGIEIELLYSLIIIICSIVIYFITKELYELSSHQGIKYFRQAFLFFVIAYFLRSFIKVLLHYFNVVEIFDIPKHIFPHVTLFIFMYFSSMAVFYLLYSVIWKGGDENRVYLFHGLALIIAVLSAITKDITIRLIIHLFLLLVVFYIVYYSYSKEKNKSLFFIYVLLLVFWILNIFDILIPNVLRTFQLALYVASALIFFFILYKVISVLGGRDGKTSKT